MLYYYCLLRFKISSRIHHFNRINLDKSWKKHLEDRRKLRVASSKDGVIKKIKDYLKIPKGV
jgi:hypothetical protein